MEASVIKFVPWEVPALNSLRDTLVYRLRAMINSDIPLNRAQKNWITAKVNNNPYFNNAIPHQGWLFKFSDVLKRYVVKQDGRCREIFAIDKTSVREYLRGNIEYIVEIK